MSGRRILRLILDILVLRDVVGLQCWTCQNARSNFDCNRFGYLKTCDQNEVYCQNEVRIVQGKGRHITKQCKQARACTNNEKQNVAGESQIQCYGDKHQSVCRCCCKEDNCNGPLIRCGKVEMCERPPDPENGRIVCPDKIRFGTVCKLRCGRGFTPRKTVTLKCDRRSGGEGVGAFADANETACVRRPPRCRSLVGKIPHGTVSCNNAPPHVKKLAKNFEGTLCNFKCRRNSFLSGQSSVSCREGHWSDSIPVCSVVRCPIPPKHVQTLVKCTRGNRFGSACRYSCGRGFKIIGERISRCQRSGLDPSRGEWTNGVPVCRRVVCRLRVAPDNGEVFCTDQNFEGSVCTFACKAGYDIEGTESQSVVSECQDNGHGVGLWTAPAPTCVRIICHPVIQQPPHGNVVCSNENRWGSSCVFDCDAGYDLDNTVAKVHRIFCQAGSDGNAVGEWSGRPGTCSPVVCVSARKAPINGYVACSNHNYAGSVCTFRCKTGFDLDKTARRTYTNKCVDMRFGLPRGDWDEPPPTCNRRIYCRRKHSRLENGEVECTNENFVGSSCRFTCNQGYRLRGIHYSNCVELIHDGDDVAEWTNEAPRCEPKSCSVQWYDPASVNEECTGENGALSSYRVLGTSCRYSCKEDGYYAARDDSQIVAGGVVVAKCLPTLTWSERPPRCFVKTCRHLHAPQNGYEPVCSRGNQFGSSCEFGCKYGFKISHPSPLTCINDKRGRPAGRWHTAPPTCSPYVLSFTD